MKRSRTLKRQLQRFGLADTYPHQKKTIEAILDGSHTLSVFPTGGGKSLCFQLPALVLQPQLTIVASPLIALMEDQIRKLRELGINAVTINHTIPPGEREKIYEDINAGRVEIVYAAPETLATRGFYQNLKRQVGLVAIDEAHCVSSWGHNFRPTYLTLADVVRSVGNPPVALFTATAPPLIREDIKRQLGLEKCQDIVVDVRRENISIKIERFDAYQEKIDTLVRRLTDENSTIVYASTKNDTFKC